MSINQSTKQMETMIYNLVECLADNYGFDADEAFEFSRWETDVDHVGEILKLVASQPPSKKKAAVEVVAKTISPETEEKILACKKNIALWEQKLSEGNVKDVAKQEEKIEKEKLKLAKLEESSEPAKQEPKKKEEPKKEANKEKRIKRFSPVMTSQLKSALENVNLEMSDKLKKEFQKYIEDLTDDDYKKDSLADHMRAFAKLNVPDAEEEKSDAEDNSDDIPEKVVHDVTLSQLQKLDMVTAVDPKGTFWDADNGRFVKGPDADDDEDFSEVEFEGKQYVVGDKTGRVYESVNGVDVSTGGFVGVGKFKKMTTST
jgi:hypothetical protein